MSAFAHSSVVHEDVCKCSHASEHHRTGDAEEPAFNECLSCGCVKFVALVTQHVHAKRQ
jgi:hypothetical protein